MQLDGQPGGRHTSLPAAARLWQGAGMSGMELGHGLKPPYGMSSPLMLDWPVHSSSRTSIQIVCSLHSLLAANLKVVELLVSCTAAGKKVAHQHTMTHFCKAQTVACLPPADACAASGTAASQVRGLVWRLHCCRGRGLLSSPGGTAWSWQHKFRQHQQQ